MDRTGSSVGAEVGGGPRHDDKAPSAGKRAVLVSVAALLALAAAAAGVWWITVGRSTAPSSRAGQAELESLDAKLKQVQGTITPIAREFTSESSTGAIDVSAYRARVDETRRLVDGINGLEITDPNALQVRDLIVTGGSEVLAGMDAALDALTSDDASAAVPAATQVDTGMSTLQDARDLLDSLYSGSSQTLRPEGYRCSKGTSA